MSRCPPVSFREPRDYYIRVIYIYTDYVAFMYVSTLYTHTHIYVYMTLHRAASIRPRIGSNSCPPACRHRRYKVCPRRAPSRARVLRDDDAKMYSLKCRLLNAAVVMHIEYVLTPSEDYIIIIIISVRRQSSRSHATGRDGRRRSRARDRRRTGSSRVRYRKRKVLPHTRG